MAVDHNNPQSRNEEILIAAIDGKEYNKLPQSRIEELLLELKEVIEAGSGGGIKPIGVTTTPLYDGATTNPIQINGESYTAETGDMVTYQSTEFLFNVNEVWQELGDVSVVLSIIDNIFADIAPAFSASSTYAVGDYVIYNDQLYKCTTAHTGAWAAADFTATNLSDEIKNNKGTVYTAGKYINIDANNEISVNPVVPNEAFTYRIYGNNGHHTVEKIVDGVVVHSENHEAGEFDPPIIYDDAIKITYYNAGSMKYELLIPSDAHEVGYVQTWAWWNNIDFTETFSTVDHTGEKLITKSELDSALAGKQATLTAGDYISIDAQNSISVNRELTPHQTSYRIKGTGRDTMNITKYIDGVQESSTDYTYSQGTTRTIDDAFTINDTYSSDGYIWQFVWLKDSTTHNKDYIVEYRSYEGAFDFTEVFNDEDLSGYKLVIKSELDAVESRIVCTEIVYDDSASLFTLPSGVPKPKDGAQIMVCGRNRSTGAIYALWFDNSANGFKIGKILDGSAPADGISISVQYIA